PYSNNAVNIALIPNTSTPITINNVNSTSNSQYYIDNGTGSNAPYNSSNFYVQYDGFTVVLTARYAVTCGQTYHIKIAIGDASDTAWDSGVFLQAGSFASTGQVVPTLGTGVNMPNDSTIIEGCGEVPFSFRRVGGDSTNADTVHLTIGGTSTPGVDYYPPFPAELIFQPGDTMITFPLNFPFDADGIETLTIEIVQILACSGLQVTNDYTFYIDQFPALYVWAPNVQGQCQQSYVIAPVQEGGTGSYGYLWSTGDTTQAITVAVNATTTFYVTVTDTCSVLPVTDSITVFIPVHPPLQLESETPIKLHCDQDSILLTATYGGGYGDLDIHWGDSLFVAGDQLWVPGEQDGDYIVSVSDECQSSTSQLVHVDAGCEVIIPNVITPNGDGSNDAFVIKGILGRENHVQIFNRWGISVLDVTNYTNNFQAKDLPDGVYFYNIQVLDKKYSGTLTVLGNK
ncbi:MAG: choice-of-anchor L domain-containing protein, partial [Flavobacteriales bacterium]